LNQLCKFFSLLDTVKVQPWITHSKHSVICLRFVVDIVLYMVQCWVFHDGFLPRDAFEMRTS